MSMQQLAAAQVNAEVVVNENFETLEHQSVYGKKHTTTTGLTWGVYGGRWGGNSVSDGTVSLTASNTNYLVVARATGVLSSSTTSTNWDNTTDYARVYKITTGTSSVSAVEDHRVGPFGVHGQSDASGGGGTVDLTTDVTGVLPIANGGTGASTIAAARAAWGEKVQSLTDGATISVDASLANNFRVTLGGNRTLANPTNLIDGQVLNFRIFQDGTGSRTLSYGTKYKFPGGTAPVLSTAASAKDFMSCQYDSTDDTLFCVLNKAFA